MSSNAYPSIVDKLETLVGIKEDIKTAIISKGVEVNTIEFNQYAGLINSIEQKDPQTELELVETKKELADTKSELAELKALMERVKEDLKTIIENYGGTVADDMPLEGYPSIVEEVMEGLGELEGKKALVETIVNKLPHLEDTLTVNTPLKEITKYVMIIGPINFKLVDKVNLDNLPISNKATPILTSMQDSVGSEMYIDQINRYRDTFTPINLILKSNHSIDLK